MNTNAPESGASTEPPFARPPGSPPVHTNPGHRLRLALSALGVVYGDIGTSPLYALRQCFGEHGVAPTAPNILGVLSLIFWSLTFVISIKYLLFVMRADNQGEGGILALMAIVRRRGQDDRGERRLVVTLGLFGAALLYGDGMITPAISVLSAVEGLGVATPYFTPHVIPITLAILAGIFLVQRHGTARVGAIFGPVTLIWFIVIGLLGTRAILAHPQIFTAVNPLYGLRFFANNGAQGLLVLGAVFLVVTGGEALYADMGHFGRAPIRLGWFSVVLPALLLNYFGQGALMLLEPAAVENPFYRMAPIWALYPLVLLATAATVIASQAVISGCFSLTRQAIQLGFCPRMEIAHTSPEEVGQIYLPGINRILLVATMGLVLGFRSSGALAAAYGIAVTTTMVITTLIFYVAARDLWKWGRLPALALAASFLLVDLSFFAANVAKIQDGGWFPLLVAGFVFLLLSTWKRGRQILAERLRVGEIRLSTFLQDVAAHPPLRVPGTAVFLAGRAYGVPQALLHNLKHNKVLHQRVILLTALTAEVPHVPPRERTDVEALSAGFYRVVVRYGFMNDPNIPEALRLAGGRGLDIDSMSTTYFLARETLMATDRPGMPIWREKLFALMARNAQRATAFFHLPPNQVIEIGTQVEL